MLGSSVQCILHDMSKDALESFAMGQHGHFGRTVAQHRAGMCQTLRLHDALQQGPELHRLALVDRGLLHQLRHQAAHALLHVANGVEHVRLELGVVLVALGVAQHQRQLGHQVLEVMDHEGRHAVEGVELAHLQQGLGGLHAGEVAGCLAAGHLSGGEDFDVGDEVVLTERRSRGLRLRNRDIHEKDDSDAQTNHASILRQGQDDQNDVTGMPARQS